jgi:hypothetical protein
MTLIAGLSRNGCPILMGDLLVSSDTIANDDEFFLPTLGKISLKHLSKGVYRPTSFCQKVNLLSSQLVIAWAGSRIYAKTFMKEIIDSSLHHNPTLDSITKVYNDIDCQDQLNIIGLYRNGVEMCMFDFNSCPIDPPDASFECFKMAGSGYSGLVDVTHLLARTVTSGTPNRLEQGVFTSLILITALLSREFYTDSIFQDIYGAGYEILHPMGSGLEKFKNLTYLFWMAKEEEHGKWNILAFPFLAVSYSYHGDILVIRSVRLESRKSNKSINSCVISSDELHFICPLYRKIDESEFVGYVPTSLNTPYICIRFCWKIIVESQVHMPYLVDTRNSRYQ